MKDRHRRAANTSALRWLDGMIRRARRRGRHSVQVFPTFVPDLVVRVLRGRGYTVRYIAATQWTDYENCHWLDYTTYTDRPVLNIGWR